MTEQWTHTVVGGPWPERIGRRCRIVPRPNGVDTYPWNDRRGSQAIILVEDDPHRKPHETAEWYERAYGGEWSCCIDPGDIDEGNRSYD